MKFVAAGIVSSFIAFSGSPSFSGICDYRLSELVGSFGAGSAVVGATAVAGSDVAMKAAGIYLITNYTTGAVMLGSTAAGSSAAGTVGIIGGSAGLVGAVASILSAPAVAIGAVASAVAAVGLEGGCYFADERITDYDRVLTVMRAVAAKSEPREFMLVNADKPGRVARILVHTGPGQYDDYRVEDLYLVNGELMNRDWFLNTDIGRIQVMLQ